MSNIIQRTRAKNCKTCDTWGAVIWKQRDKLTGLMVDVVWRCSCAAGLDNYPSLPPHTSAPRGDYEPTEAA